jgi:HlyD family secretion protein
MQAMGHAMTADQHRANDRAGGMARKLAIVAGLASLGLAGFAVALMITPGNPIQIRFGSSSSTATTTPAASQAAATQLAWLAAAPGRVEPRSGQIRIGTGVAGKVEKVSVNMNDRVAEGEVLIRLEDKEARARLSSAEAQAALSKRERDNPPAGAPKETSSRDSINKAEDAVYNAERAVMSARFELDDAIAADRKTPGNQALAGARRRHADAVDRLRQEHSALASAISRSGSVAPIRLEAGLIAARSEVTLAESLLDKTRIRAPIAGKVLQINAKLGELVAPTPELPLVVMGDMSIVRVRAEVDEPDVAKIKLGQRVSVKNNAYPGREFDGKVAEIAPSLALPRMGSRGARRTTDVEVMEVLIDLDGSVPLLPGMRVDAFFMR